MSRSLGIISASFALRNHVFALKTGCQIGWNDESLSHENVAIDALPLKRVLQPEPDLHAALRRIDALGHINS